MLKKVLRSIFGKAEKGVLSKEAFRKYLPENAIVLEAGASDGTDTLELSEMYPNAQIHAFEPIPVIFDTLKGKVGHKDNVHLYPIALSNENGSAEIHVSSGKTDGASSLLPPKEHLTFHKDVHFEETIHVSTQTLDKWAEEQGIKRVDFMWLDMQGMEFSVLEASKIILPTVKVIYTEVSLIETYEGVKPYEEFKNWMISQGFNVEKELLPWKDMGNVLFVRL